MRPDWDFFVEFYFVYRFLFLLPIVGVLAMLAQEMFVKQDLWYAVPVTGHELGMKGHHGHFFQHDGVVNGVEMILSISLYTFSSRIFELCNIL